MQDRQALKEMLRAQLENLELEDSLKSLMEEQDGLKERLEKAKAARSEETSKLELTITDLQSQLEAAKSNKGDEIDNLESSLKAVQIKIKDMETRHCRLKEQL